MTDTTATFDDVALFDGRIPALGACRRVVRFVVGGAVIGLATVAAACAFVAAVTMAAGWIIVTGRSLGNGDGLLFHHRGREFWEARKHAVNGHGLAAGRPVETDAEPMAGGRVHSLMPQWEP